MVLRFCPIPILAPAEMLSAPVEPFKLDTTLALAAGAGTEIVTEPFPTPTEAIPAPEKFRRLVNVPADEEVVLPNAVRDLLTVCTEAEIVMLLAPEAKATLAPATSDTLEDVPLRLKFVAAGTVGPTSVRLLAPLLIVMLAPATRLTLLDVPLRLKLVAAGTLGPITVIVGLVES